MILELLSKMQISDSWETRLWIITLHSTDTFSFLKICFKQWWSNGEEPFPAGNWADHKKHAQGFQSPELKQKNGFFNPPPVELSLPAYLAPSHNHVHPAALQLLCTSAEGDLQSVGRRYLCTEFHDCALWDTNAPLIVCWHLFLFTTRSELPQIIFPQYIVPQCSTLPGKSGWTYSGGTCGWLSLMLQRRTEPFIWTSPCLLTAY